MALTVLNFEAVYFDDQWRSAPSEALPGMVYTTTCPGNACAEITIRLVGADMLELEKYEVPGGQPVIVVGHTIHLPELAEKK